GDDAHRDTGQHGPSGKRIGNEQTGREQDTKLALRPAEKLNERAWYGPHQEPPGDIGRRPGFDCCDIDPVNRWDEPLREIGRMGEPYGGNSDQECEHCRIELLAATVELETHAAAEATQDIAAALRSYPMSANAGPVAALKPTRSPSATGGKPIRKPMSSVISATAKAGTQPERIAAMPTTSPRMKPANPASITKAMTTDHERCESSP